MPRRNGTGPMGQGSMTGRGMGNCQGGAGQAFVDRAFAGRGGAGRGRVGQGGAGRVGAGAGRCMGGGRFRSGLGGRDEEVRALTEEVNELRKRLDAMQKKEQEG